MRRYLLPLLILPALALVTAALVASTTGRPDHGRVYSVAEVRAHLASNAGAWVGRAVRLRAIADPCQMWGSTEEIGMTEKESTLYGF